VYSKTDELSFAFNITQVSPVNVYC